MAGDGAGAGMGRAGAGRWRETVRGRDGTELRGPSREGTRAGSGGGAAEGEGRAPPGLPVAEPVEVVLVHAEEVPHLMAVSYTHLTLPTIYSV